MLIVSETRYVPTAVNMMVLQGSDDLYYYVHRSLYDQCTVLYDLYGQNIEALYKLIGWEKDVPAVCGEFYLEVPEPLSVLAPFLTLIGGCEELEGVEEMCGALSSISRSIDFRKMLKVPMQIRQSVKFSLHVREEYRVQWDRFFTETPTYEEVDFAHNRYDRDFDEEDYQDTVDDNPYANATFIGDDVALPSPEEFAALGAAVTVDTEPTPEPTPTPTPTASTTPSGFDLLRGLK